MKKIVGYYNLDGYRIVDFRSGEVLTTAGNNPVESSSIVDREQGLPLETIKIFCERTGGEMAEELKAVFIGAFKADED